MTTKSSQLEALDKQVANSSEKNRNFFTATLLVFVYLVIVVAQTSDLDLLIGHGVHLPLVGIDMSMFAFYLVAPVLALALHFNLLQNIENHHLKLIAWRNAYPNQQVPRENIYPFIFDFASLDNHGGLSKITQLLSQIVIYWSGPIAILLILWRFTDYQSLLATIWHTGLLSADLWLVMVCRKNIDSTNAAKPTPIAFPSTKWRNLIKLLECTLKSSWLFCKKLFTWCIQDVSKHKVSNAIGIVIWCCAVIQTLLLLCVTSLNLPNLSSIESFTQKTEDTLLMQSHPEAPVYIAKYASSKDKSLYSRMLIELFFPRLAIDPKDSLLNLDAEKTKLEFELSPRPVILDEDVDAALENNDLPAKAHRASSLYDWFMTGNGKGIDLRGRNLHFADLSVADLRFSSLEKANFQNANLSGADLYGAKLSGTQLQYANLSNTNLRTSLENTKLQGASLEYSKLYYTNFFKTDLTEVNMTAAELYGASLFDTALHKVNLKHAKLINININDKTNFDGCKTFDAKVEVWVDKNGHAATNNMIWKKHASLDQTKTDELLARMYKQGWPKEATKQAHE